MTLADLTEYLALDAKSRKSMDVVLRDTDLSDAYTLRLTREYMRAIWMMQDSRLTAEQAHWDSYVQGIGYALDLLSKQKRGVL